MTTSWSLTNRIFLATALMAILSIGLAIYVVNVAVTRQAEDELRRGLEGAAALVDQNRDLLFEQFAREARLIADLPKLKAAVGVNHPPTMQPIAVDYQAQIGSDIFVVTNAQVGVLAQIGHVDLAPDRVARLPSIKTALMGRAAASFWPRRGGDVQVVTIPIWIDESQPELLGTLSVGFSLDEQLAARLKQLTASDIAFVVDGAVQASTLPAEYSGTLADAVQGGREATLRLGDEEYVAVTRALSTSGAFEGVAVTSDDGGDSGIAPVAIVLRSRTEQLEFLRSLQTALAATGVLAVLLATLISYGVARTVTRPVGAIIATMREMSNTGDLTTKIHLPGRTRWHDEETTLLANTFNTMTDSIARFQREAAQRERLSSLGRLSTVVAHEIRNPLMIIKAALRTLKRQDELSEPAQMAAEDIDEEVDRLNRIVGEVLDFARPIRFELGPVDVNGLCADAVAAATADGEWPFIRTALDPAVASLVTDGERLRLTLVNILTNARQSIRERQNQGTGAGGSTETPEMFVDLGTSAHDGSIVISVRYSGIGIASEDRPRVFEPYFTTKRTGSGLGLAIAKNIIDGLGGTISIRSEVGGGTEMRIELPRRPSEGAEP